MTGVLMSVKLTRAEKASDRFQEVFKKEVGSGNNPRAALRKARRKLSAEKGYPNRRK